MKSSKTSKTKKSDVKTKRADFVQTPIADCIDQIDQLERYIVNNQIEDRAPMATDTAEIILEACYAQLERLQSE